METYKRLFFKEDSSGIVITIPLLEKLYKELNNLYFNGELNNYPIFIKSIKYAGAQVLSSLNRITKIKTVKRIEFDRKYYYNNLDELKGVMLHEMIHVYMAQNQINDYGGAHGLIFKQHLKDLSKKVSFEIPLTYDSNNKKINTSVVKSKKIIVLRKGNSIALLNYKLKSDILNRLKYIEDFRKIYIYNKILIYETISPLISVLPIPILSKLKNSFKLYKVTDEILNELKSNKLLFDYDKPYVILEKRIKYNYEFK